MNKKFLKSLLAVALLASAADVQAHTNKTFLAPRKTGVNLPMETLGFRELVNRKDEDKFGANFQVTGFYKGSTGKAKLGKYFGVNEHNNVSFGSATTDFGTITSMINANDAGGDKLAAAVGNISFNPKHTEYGARIDYFQELGKVIKGLYLKANLPIVHVENDMKIGANVTTSAVGLTNADLINYFKGIKPTLTNTTQAALTNGLINGKQSKTGVADINVALGYRFFNKEKYNASINLACSIPTGNGATGHYLFEPVTGYKNFGFGGGLDGMIRVWGDADQNIKLNAAVDYKYLFKATEKRMLGINNHVANDNIWGQYTLVATKKNATDITASTIQPAANVFTQNVGVTPGSQVDGIIDICYNKGGLNLTLGYNLYYREAESVKRKDAYTDGAYGIFDVTKAVGTDIAPSAFINNTDLLTSNAATDSQFTNSIYGGVNYMFKEWKYPLLLGAGGSYEFVSKNSAVEGWTALIKVGMGF